jgi:hypothetical protein
VLHLTAVLIARVYPRTGLISVRENLDGPVGDIHAASVGNVQTTLCPDTPIISASPTSFSGGIGLKLKRFVWVLFPRTIIKTPLVTDLNPRIRYGLARIGSRDQELNIQVRDTDPLDQLASVIAPRRESQTDATREHIEKPDVASP